VLVDALTASIKNESCFHYICESAFGNSHVNLLGWCGDLRVQAVTRVNDSLDEFDVEHKK
jgi:hypothetical protein